MLAEFPAAADALAIRIPAAPHTLEETGLSFDLLEQLVLKTLHFSGEMSGADLGRRLGLTYSAFAPVLEHLKHQYLVEVMGGGLRGRPRVRLPHHRGRAAARPAVPRAEPLRRRGAGAVRQLRGLHARVCRGPPAQADTRRACATPSASWC